ncbi:TrkH family potassium uptake protein [Anianabacter salinae]|uniref:TrkH family potassium uptake protein n=1 Tax=Anianabacter salinae TaxID=2851023 RepID=UPI00225E17FD|nr:TrkH family potassium uptake protein [Anianabacter salinae]MBV0912495.1 TrkH family potassium uptake protein [Anianabacter salinae]
MVDFRPVAQIVGLLLVLVGALMVPSSLLDLDQGGQSASIFAISALVTMAFGGAVYLATRNHVSSRLDIRQAFLLTTTIWVVLPLAGAIPFVFGAPQASKTDAYFEAVSGMTTTGSTVFTGLDNLPNGVLLWRGILQWLGGLGIVIVALIFLPVMKVGGMQFFRTEGFDTLGKVLPRATDISRRLLEIYVVLTVICAIAYATFGMTFLEAVVHALTTMSTGGFSTSDASFAKFSGPLEYVSVVFMILASLPFIRYVQLVAGNTRPIFEDVQTRAYVRWLVYAICVIILYRLMNGETDFLVILRETMFNVVTLFSGTGYGSADVLSWGSFPFTVIIIVGLIGGCTASTGCSIKVFRWLVAFEAIRIQIRRLGHPSGVFSPKMQGQKLTPDVFDSVIAFFGLFIVSFGVLSVLLGMCGLPFLTAFTAAWTSIANVGPAWGSPVGPTGAMDAFPESAKWLMIAGMIVGRLEVLSVYVLFIPTFWRG